MRGRFRRFGDSITASFVRIHLSHSADVECGRALPGIIFLGDIPIIGLLLRTKQTIASRLLSRVVITGRARASSGLVHEASVASYHHRMLTTVIIESLRNWTKLRTTSVREIGVVSSIHLGMLHLAVIPSLSPVLIEDITRLKDRGVQSGPIVRPDCGEFGSLVCSAPSKKRSCR